MSAPGQVTIAGEVISGAKLQIGPLTLETVPTGLTWDELATLSRGDHIRIEAELVVADSPHTRGKYDGDTGDETGASTGTFNLKPLRQGFRVTSVLTKAQREEAWREAHGVA